MSFLRAETAEIAREFLPVSAAPVVVVLLTDDDEVSLKCLRALSDHTPPDIPLIVVDDARYNRSVVDALERLSASRARSIVSLARGDDREYGATANRAFSAAGRKDVVVVGSGVLVGAEWFQRISAAVGASSTVATACALSDASGPLAIQIPAGMAPEDASRRVIEGSGQLRPRLLAAVGQCVFIRRVALDVVGFFDPGLTAESALADFSRRASACAFEHVLADDVLVLRAGGAGQGSEGETVFSQRSDSALQGVYPHYGSLVERIYSDDKSRLAAALLAVRCSVAGMTVAVDALCLATQIMGTQTVVLATIRALAIREDIARIIVYARPDVPEYLKTAVAPYNHVVVVPTKIGEKPTELADVLYRPYQLWDPAEISWMRSAAHRVIVTWLDLISYQNHQYFFSDRDWSRYRDLARLTFATADGITFLSNHVLETAKAEGLVDDGVPTRVTYCGSEPFSSPPAAPERPAGAERLEPGYILILGMSYLHKNRMFGLQLLSALRVGGWDGMLVLAGARPLTGSSTEDETDYLTRNPDIAESVINLGPVSEAEKSWLYSRSGLVLYPTVSEGFGLVPFEAAQFEVPCLSSRMGSLSEVLGPDIETIDEFDPASVADVALRLLTDKVAARAMVDKLLERAKLFTWDRSVDEAISLFRDVVTRPQRRTIGILGEYGTHRIDRQPRVSLRKSPLVLRLQLIAHLVRAHPAVRARFDVRRR